MIENFLRPPHGVVDYLADAVRLVGLLSVVAAAIVGTATDAGILAFSLPALVAPRFIGVRAWFDAIFGIAVLVAAWSNVLDLYTTIAGWDVVVHVVCTGLIAVTMYLALAQLGIVEHPGDGTVRLRVALVLTTAFGLAASALWEMVEWAGHAFITDEIFVTYPDTIGDMIAGAAGSVAGGVLLAAVPLLRPGAVRVGSTPR
ncbi:hypothetical protein ACFQZV_00470 [Microbacterium koreense]|uniref:DUF2238 domain-containing protein n=1 Tax=Microbacterium koreense TaxID=323761 RepID=A0ABW2ZME5_9MICO